MPAAVVSILTRIPWKEILKYSPVILDNIPVIINKVRLWFGPKEPERLSSNISEPNSSALEERITKIEIFEKEQSELVANVGIQLEEVTSAMLIISKRVNYFMILSFLGFLIALVAFILVLFKL
jgi:hypothetical protein